MNKKLIFTDLELNNEMVRVSGVTVDGNLTDISCMKAHSERLLGNVYVGRVQKVVESLNAAFIDIGPNQTCYYPISKNCAPVFVKCANPLKLTQGDELLVQIESEAVKTKFPTVTTNICLTGRYCVISSENKRIGYSAKLSADEKSRIVSCLDHIHFSGYGMIFRTNSREALNGQIIDEANNLINALDSIIEAGKTRTLYSCIHRDQRYLYQYLNGTYCEDLDEVVTDIPDVYDALSAYVKGYDDIKDLKIRFYDDASYSLAKCYNLSKQLDHATERKVWLKSGGYLVIDQTEALTVIDVNSGKSVKNKKQEESYYKTNLEAAKEAAKQMRLRNISGIIIIDFIDLKDRDFKDELIKTMKKLVFDDPVPTKVIDFTKLNLMEITRKKVEKSLKEQLTNRVDCDNI